jgi:hypothetical protein
MNIYYYYIEALMAEGYTIADTKENAINKVQEEYGDYGVSARRLLVIETCNYSNVKG